MGVGERKRTEMKAEEENGNEIWQYPINQRLDHTMYEILRGDVGIGFTSGQRKSIYNLH